MTRTWWDEEEPQSVCRVSTEERGVLVRQLAGVVVDAETAASPAESHLPVTCVVAPSRFRCFPRGTRTHRAPLRAVDNRSPFEVSP